MSITSGTAVALPYRHMGRFVAIALPLLMSCGLLIARLSTGSGHRSPGSEPPPERRAEATLTVATFNMHFGLDERGRYNLQRTVDTLAALDADVIGVQEVLRAHPRYHCDDQPAQLAEGLRRATRVRWEVVYMPAAISDGGDDECVRLGRASVPPTEGVLLLARVGLAPSTVMRLPGERAALRAGLEATPGFDVAVTHLTAYARNAALRRRQTEELAPWGGVTVRGRILLGDLNAEPGALELAPLLRRYQDAWVVGRAAASVSGPAMGGSTRPGRDSRIDYVLFDGPGLTLRSVHVVQTTSGQFPWEASDHRPVVAVFRLGEP